MPTQINPEYIRSIRPEMSTLDDLTLMRFIAKAVNEMNEKAWGDLYEEGVENLTLHLLTLEVRARNAALTGGASSGGGALTGVLKWEQTGVFQKGYSVPSASSSSSPVVGSNQWFEQSTYGTRYAYLQSLIFADRTGMEGLIVL